MGGRDSKEDGNAIRVCKVTTPRSSGCKATWSQYQLSPLPWAFGRWQDHHVALVTQLGHLCRQRTCESCVAPVQAEVTNVRRRDLGHVGDEAGDKQDVRGSRGLANAEERRLQGRRAVLHGLSAASGGAPESHGESGPLAAASAQALSPAGLKSVPGPEWCEAAQSPDTHRGAWRAPELTVLPAMAGVCERESLCLQPEASVSTRRVKHRDWAQDSLFHISCRIVHQTSKGRS